MHKSLETARWNSLSAHPMSRDKHRPNYSETNYKEVRWKTFNTRTETSRPTFWRRSEFFLWEKMIMLDYLLQYRVKIGLRARSNLQGPKRTRSTWPSLWGWSLFEPHGSQTQISPVSPCVLAGTTLISMIHWDYGPGHSRVSRMGEFCHMWSVI